MIPALSFTGMLPSKLILRENSMQYNPSGERGKPVSLWWESNKDAWDLESRLDANPTVYIFQDELEKLRARGEDVEHIISQFTERFGFVGFLPGTTSDDIEINIVLSRPPPTQPRPAPSAATESSEADFSE